MTDGLTLERAERLLLARVRAHDSLAEFARYIDIPSVPSEDSGDDKWAVVETPLASHHLMMLSTLQALVDGALMYDSASMCRAKPPAGVASVGGVGSKKHTHPLQTPQFPELPITPYAHQDGSTEPFSSAGENVDGQKMIKSAKIHGDIPSERALVGVGSASHLPQFIDPEQFLSADAFSKVCRRVMLMFPPGSAKSTYASVVFPAWQMGRNSDEEIILTGWGDPICRKHGKRARQLCRSPLYRSVFGIDIDPQTGAAEDWALTNGSSYKSSGINSGVAGFRCNGLVWDDLTKNRKEADSPLMRNDIYNAYLDDARSRKKPDAWEVGIGTRWHENEIMGRILPEGYAGESGFMECRDGNVWFVLCIPAQCERDDDPLGRQVGEYLWPEWFGEGYWDDKKVNPRSWASLYQQRPAPEEGIYFKKEWFRTYSTEPEGDYYISFDPAVTESEEADSTAILIWKVNDRAQIYLVDEWVSKCTMDVWIEALLRKGMLFKPIEIISEAGVIRRAAEPFIKRAMLHLKSFFRFEWITRHADKSAMARSAQGMLASGQVYVPENSVGQNFMDELLRFPAGKDDHRVDAFANLCLRLESIWEATPPKDKDKKPDIISGEVMMKVPPRFPKRKSRWSRVH